MLRRKLLSQVSASTKVEGKENTGTKVFSIAFGKGCLELPFISTFVVIVNLSADSYKLTFRQRIIVKPIDIVKLVNIMQRQNLHISIPFKRVSVYISSRRLRRGHNRSSSLPRPPDCETPKISYQKMQNQNLYHHGKYNRIL